jgi:hypothetical protein
VRGHQGAALKGQPRTLQNQYFCRQPENVLPWISFGQPGGTITVAIASYSMLLLTMNGHLLARNHHQTCFNQLGPIIAKHVPGFKAFAFGGGYPLKDVHLDRMQAVRLVRRWNIESGAYQLLAGIFMPLYHATIPCSVQCLGIGPTRRRIV